jgi:phage terminase small subunit
LAAAGLKISGALFGPVWFVIRLRMSEDQELGPAMAALNERQRAFVMAMIEHPGITQARAAELAGYKNSPGGMKVHGHYCAHNPAVQAAIREEAGKRLNSASLLAANVLVEILGSDDIPAKERLKAAGMLLDRTGFAAVQKIDVTRKDESGANVLDQIKRLAEKLSVPVQQLLNKPAPPVVDAEFSEVKGD